MKKPGPVFLEMARAAYTAGADYFYRINDDTELMVNWPAKFVAGMLVSAELVFADFMVQYVLMCECCSSSMKTWCCHSSMLLLFPSHTIESLNRLNRNCRRRLA
jgi:hypothetical protein